MKRMLIVEDETALLDAYTLLFQSRNYEVSQAANGREALKALQGKRFDYIVLDILMPVMGGVDFLESAGIPENHPDTKVLVLSNLSDKKTIDTVKRLGATKYLLKAGTSPGELVDALESM